MKSNAIHWIYYIVSIFIVTASAGLCIINISLPEFIEDLNELSGIICAILMGFELALYLGIEIVKRKLLPKSLQKHGIWATRYLRSYHLPVGSIACSVLIAHILLSWEIGDPLAYESITGLFCTAFLVLSILFGLIYKMNRKLMTKLHVIASFVAVAPFVMHIAD
jgi:apolipoprotein N-acyltransferase